MSTYDRRRTAAVEPNEPADLIADASKFLAPLDRLEHELGSLLDDYRAVQLRHAPYAISKLRPRVLSMNFQAVMDDFEKARNAITTVRADIWTYINAAKHL